MFSLLFCLLAQCSCRTQVSWKSCSNCVLQILLLHAYAASSVLPNLQELIPKNILLDRQWWKWNYFTFYTHTKKKFIHGPPKYKFLAPPLSRQRTYLNIRAFALALQFFVFYFSIRTNYFYFIQPLFKNTHIKLFILHSFFF